MSTPPDYVPIAKELGALIESDDPEPLPGTPKGKLLPKALRDAWVIRVLAGEPMVDALRQCWTEYGGVDYAPRSLELQVASLLAMHTVREALSEGHLLRGRQTEAVNVLLWGAIPAVARATRAGATKEDLHRGVFALRVVALVAPPPPPDRKPPDPPARAAPAGLDHRPRSLEDIDGP